MSVYDWSTVPFENQTADPTINWQEGQSTDTVNNSARAMMSAVAAYVAMTSGATVSTGAGGAYTVASPSGFELPSYSFGQLVVFRANHENTTAPTIRRDGLGFQPLVMQDGEAIAAGEIKAGAVIEAVYDGTSFKALSGVTNANLKAFGNLAGQADSLPYFDGAASFGQTTLTSFMRSLLGAGSASAAQSILGLTGFLTQSAGDARYLNESSNLSDLTNSATARSNLGLGGLATQSSVSTSQVSGVMPISKGGTGQSNAAAALSAIGGLGIVSQSLGLNGHIEFTNGLTVNWGTFNAGGTTFTTRSYQRAHSSFSVPLVGGGVVNNDRFPNPPFVNSAGTSSFQVYNPIGQTIFCRYISIGV